MTETGSMDRKEITDSDILECESPVVEKVIPTFRSPESVDNRTMYAFVQRMIEIQISQRVCVKMFEP